VVPRFLQQAITGGSIVLFGDGSQTRDFIYVDDVVSALVTAATAKEVNRQVINIGSGVETSVDKLVDEIEKVNGRSVNRIYNREKTGGVPRLVADISRAQALLGFRPQINLATGLLRILGEDSRFVRQSG
ncbi:MAG: NAD-dependent epimerase/dehydratase family protein, partial [Aquificales bacterium]|nr:NAD-dependent epimerase/dehydratase family protein [Aquificales bacterium]